MRAGLARILLIFAPIAVKSWPVRTINATERRGDSMKKISDYEKKYRKQQDRNGNWKYPAGGADIYDLCDTINNLVKLIRKLQCGNRLSMDEQNQVEKDLFIIFG